MAVSALIFDLDDTLYPEEDYVRCALGAAAEVLSAQGFGDHETLVEGLWALHAGERDDLYGRGAEVFGYPASLVPALVDAHRGCVPQLTLDAMVAGMLRRLRCSYRTAILTDGHGSVQRAKLNALAVADLVDVVVVADDLGREAWKPSPHGVLSAAKSLGVDPAGVVVVGDNPARDMAAARAAGARSIRVRRPGGFFVHYEAEDLRADFEVIDVLEVESLVDDL